MANSIHEALDRARALDLRRQAQIAEQVKIINRMIAGENTYDHVLQALAGELARYKVERDELVRQVAKYRMVPVDQVIDELFPGISNDILKAEFSEEDHEYFCIRCGKSGKELAEKIRGLYQDIERMKAAAQPISVTKGFGSSIHSYPHESPE